MSSILIITEGKRPELAIINKINELLNLGFTAQVVYGADIYQLYRLMYEDKFVQEKQISVLNTYDLIHEYVNKANDPDNIKMNERFLIDIRQMILLLFICFLILILGVKMLNS